MAVHTSQPSKLLARSPDERIIRSATGTRDEATRLVQMSKKERADVFKTKSSGKEIVTLEALFDVFVNTFTEDSSLPGLDVLWMSRASCPNQEPRQAEIIASAGPEAEPR